MTAYTVTTEWRNYFTSVRDLALAKKMGEPLGTYLDELEAIALFTDSDLLRTRARQVVDDHNTPDTATA